MAAAKNNGRSKKAVDETPKVTKQDWERDNDKDLNIGLERSLSQRPFKKIRTSHVSLVSSVPPPSITLLHSSSTMPSSGLKEDRTLARPRVPPINTTKVYRGVKRPHSGKLEVEICIPRNMTRLWLNEAALAYNYAACKLRGMYALLNFSFLYKDIAVSTAPRISLSSLPMLHENLFPHWSSKQPQQTLKCLNLQASNMELMPPPPLGDNTSENSGLGLHDADANDEFQGIATGPGTGDGVVESKESEWEAWCNSILVGLDAGSPIRDYTWPWSPLLPCGDNPDDDLGLGLREATASEEVQAIATIDGRGAAEGADESVWGDLLNANLAGWGTGSPVWGNMCNSILAGLDAGSPIRDYTWPWPPLLPCGDNPDDDLGLGLREATASEEVQAIATLAGRGAGEGANESVWVDWLNADLAGWGTGSPVWGYMPSTPTLNSSISKRKRKEVAKEKKETEKKQNEVENQEEEEELLNKRLRRVVVLIEKEEGKESTEESKEEEKGKYQDTEKSTKRPLEVIQLVQCYPAFPKDFEPSAFAEADFPSMTRFDLNQASGIIVLNFPEPVIPMPLLFSVYDLLSIFTQAYICNSLIGPQEVEPQYKKHLDMDQAGDKIMRDLIAQIPSPPSMKEPPISTRAQRVKPILAKDDLDTLFARMEVAVSSATITSTSHTGSGVVEQTSGGTEEIEQAKAVLERCLALEFSQILESKIKAQFILALSVLSSATSEFSSAQNESIHRLWGQNTLTLNLHHSQKEFAECNKFLDRKDVLYDELKKFNDSNSTIMAQLQKLSAEKEQLMAKLTEIEATQAKLMENRKQLGVQAKTTMADWKQLNNDSAEMNMRKKIAEDHILQVSIVWSSFKVLFPLV